MGERFCVLYPDANSRKFKHFVGWLLAIYWTALFIGTHVPVPSGDLLREGFDKVIHFLAYAGLACLLNLWRGPEKWHSTLALVWVFAIADELLQIPVGRTCDIADAVADWFGATTGVLMASGIYRLGARKGGQPLANLNSP